MKGETLTDVPTSVVLLLGCLDPGDCGCLRKKGHWRKGSLGGPEEGG